ncbi:MULTISPECIES: 23S rRNA (guanosine(2251)-2'-O)-methyltransferase RlmB [Sphingobacterium]|jgi:23S rRNA (guanosine2251-2'-O)-methyltransferase|uniref:23S rRNA (guanosine(2251)-2'-O)-methyltransferase RlmB n=1 Tax=Sphingobacterium TaxID=28453 RepID=UPI0004E5F2EC|nr:MULTISPECIES: 23S rRNA (guanosine(2251)-2'-O)-methyltransferase RlmB [Sphingobacterium]CDT20714.1 putative tRNA/rRNA methyltransferase [Sphingobacterium sp. PM2-P1-29]SJN50461.1 23S rRNA (guanosine-2'-O-)-methyltransferase rlmB [Sphingobacterium faecium PCAi_F2.5]HCU44930.1 23S rRNA (guanosine(2251)-2'-O)-methyltransferase RlmB [Sphingobacterium sp.]UPZ36761.1 23S rRNA (guanosine(2251)-2'-O)-methyltransferase RlmB [Sphingobacterium sp. PCS056]UXD68276.1 23S rRNA (guanosine(2251)-2'-O)-methy
MQNFQRHDRSADREANQMVFGIRAVIEAIDSGKEIESLFIQRGLAGSLVLELKALLKEHDLGFQQVPIEKLNRITRKNHQGVIAVISPITYQKIEDIVPEIYEKGEVPLFLMLDGVTDVRNFGAIARTAECSGVHAIIVPKKGSAEVNPDAIKTSAGALYKIPVCRHEGLAKIGKFLIESGIQLVVSTEKTKDSIYDVDYTVPTCIIMGAEDTGVSDDLIRIADHLAKIPMFGEIGSLNVSVSAGVVLYEAIRQRVK